MKRVCSLHAIYYKSTTSIDAALNVAATSGESGTFKKAHLAPKPEFLPCVDGILFNLVGYFYKLSAKNRNIRKRIVKDLIEEIRYFCGYDLTKNKSKSILVYYLRRYSLSLDPNHFTEEIVTRNYKIYLLRLRYDETLVYSRKQNH